MNSPLEQRIEALEREITLIKERNARVESDKGWETSTTRKVSLIVLTYSVATLTLFLIGVENCFVSAVMPTVGYALSTLSLSMIKEQWKKKQER